VRICLVYDCLFPYTVGGAERWYRNLAERLAAEGHEVTFLTRRQWDRGTNVDVPGVRVVALEPRMGLYTADGRRRIDQALIFGAGCLAHLAMRGSAYDVVHTASFPYFSLLAAAVARPVHRFGLVIDWHEVWTREYWAEYLGSLGGRIGWIVQALCARVRQHAFCFSRLHARRLREVGLRGDVSILEGEYAGQLDPRPGREPREPLVVFAGRHIPEKRVTTLVPALERARAHAPELRCIAFGDGPERQRLVRAVAAARLDGAFAVPGFVGADEVDQALGEGLCMVLPSRREGYGQIVVEAAARGTPSVVVAGPDNASVELVQDGVNGIVAASTEAEDLADAILRVRDGGAELRRTTLDWFVRNAERLSIATSLEKVARRYRESARS
jgi:glycosyltransferase involved in cell wall biosynthesis